MAVAAASTESLSADTLFKFRLLQQRFVLGLPARWTDLSGVSTPATQRDALHRLAGGAGSYGFARMSQLAREAENLAMTGQPSKLNHALSLLKSEIDAAVADTPALPWPGV